MYKSVTVRAEYERSLKPVELMRPVDDLRLRYLFSDWRSDNALFDKFSGVPWIEVVSSKHLNRLYFGFHSGYKRPSPYLHHFIKEWVDGEPKHVVSDDDAADIAGDIEALYATKWNKIFTLWMLEIDPMNNYHWEELMQGSDATSDESSVDTKFGQTVDDSTSKSSTDTRSGEVTDNTVFNGSSTNEKTFSGKELITHDSERNLQTSNQESATDSNTRTGSVGETGATARYGFDSIASGEGEPFDRRTGNTSYNNLKDDSTKSKQSMVTETGSDGYDEEHSFTDRKDTETMSFDGRSDNNTVTYKNVTDESTADSTASRKFGGTDTTTKSGSTRQDKTHTITVNGYKDTNYYEQIERAFKAFESDFFNMVFADIDKVLALSIY